MGFEVASALSAPLDVFVVRKLGVPGQEELAFGAIASGGIRVLNQRTINLLALTSEEIEAVTAPETAELETARARVSGFPRFIESARQDSDLISVCAQHRGQTERSHVFAPHSKPSKRTKPREHDLPAHAFSAHWHAAMTRHIILFKKGR